MTATRHSLVPPALVGAAMLAVYLPTLSSLVRQWASDENASHGFLVVPCAIYFAWRDRARIAALTGRPRRFGYVIVAVSLALFVAGQLGAELFLSRLSVAGVLAGAIIALYGTGPLRAMTLPFILLLLAIPLPAVLFNRVAFPLQLLASRAAEVVLTTAGIPALREGNVLVLPSITLEVAQACSGIRSLLSLVGMAVVLGALVERRTWARVVLAAAAVPIAIVANAARVAGTGLAAEWIGPAAAEGVFHEFAGWVVFVVACALLLATGRVLRRMSVRGIPARAVAGLS